MSLDPLLSFYLPTRSPYSTSSDWQTLSRHKVRVRCDGALATMLLSSIDTPRTPHTPHARGPQQRSNWKSTRSSETRVLEQHASSCKSPVNRSVAPYRSRLNEQLSTEYATYSHTRTSCVQR